MWIRCYDCAKEVYLGGDCQKIERGGQQLWYDKSNDETWHLDIYKVRKRDMVLDSGRRDDKGHKIMWGHPSCKIFLCSKCYGSRDWYG